MFLVSIVIFSEIQHYELSSINFYLRFDIQVYRDYQCKVYFYDILLMSFIRAGKQWTKIYSLFTTIITTKWQKEFIKAITCPRIFGWLHKSLTTLEMMDNKYIAHKNSFNEYLSTKKYIKCLGIECIYNLNFLIYLLKCDTHLDISKCMLYKDLNARSTVVVGFNDTLAYTIFIHSL